MSASRERKERAQMPAAQVPAKKEKKKLSEGWILAISVVLVIVAVFGTVLGIRYYQRNQTVMVIGDKELTVKEFNHYFNQTASSYQSFASYLGINPATPVDQQKISADSIGMMQPLGMDVEILEAYKQEDGSYDITWAGYFAACAKKTAAESYAVYQAAQDAGYEMSQEVKDSIESEINNMSSYALMYGMELDEFIEANYGDGCDEETYREFLTVNSCAADYAQNLTYDAEKIDARYAETTEDFDVVSYLVYKVAATEPAETDAEATDAETTEGATDETTEETVITEEQAKEMAEAMEAEFDLTNEDITANCDQTRSTAKAVVTEEAAEWMFDTAKAGDVKLFENADTKTYYVVKLLSNDVNYKTANLMQIFIANDAEDAENHEGHDHAEGEECETLTAADKLAKVTSALEADKSEESFKKLAEEYSSTSPELEDVAYAYIESNISEDALLWIMEERAAGDYKVFETSTGTYVLYFRELSETYRNLNVNSILVQEWVKQLTETTVANCKFDMDAAMNGAVDVVLTSGQS